MLISSQRYLDDEKVQEKIQGEDFKVIVSPEFEFGDEILQVVIDGHHSYHAAIESGKKPEFVVADSMMHDAIGLLNDGEYEDFLQALRMDSDWYNIEDGINVW